MKSITVSVDAATRRWTRSAAAERSASVTRLVRRFLQSLGSAASHLIQLKLAGRQSEIA